MGKSQHLEHLHPIGVYHLCPCFHLFCSSIESSRWWLKALRPCHPRGVRWSPWLQVSPCPVLTIGASGRKSLSSFPCFFLTLNTTKKKNPLKDLDWLCFHFYSRDIFFLSFISFSISKNTQMNKRQKSLLYQSRWVVSRIPCTIGQTMVDSPWSFVQNDMGAAWHPARAYRSHESRATHQ